VTSGNAGSRHMHQYQAYEYVDPLLVVVAVVHVDRVGLCLWTAATNGPTVHPPGDILVWTATAEWYWQGKIEELGENPGTVPLCSPQISHGRNRARTPVSAVKGRPLTALVVTQLDLLLTHDFAYDSPRNENQVSGLHDLCVYITTWYKFTEVDFKWSQESLHTKHRLVVQRERHINTTNCIHS
jgi:hypothetical protein